MEGARCGLGACNRSAKRLGHMAVKVDRIFLHAVRESIQFVAKDCSVNLAAKSGHFSRSPRPGRRARPLDGHETNLKRD